MKKNKHILSIELLFALLFIACIVFGVLLGIQDGRLLLIALGVLIVVVVVLGVNVRALRSAARSLIGGKGTSTMLQKSAISTSILPAMVSCDGVVLWYNKAFLKMVNVEGSLPIVSLVQLLPQLDCYKSFETSGQDIDCGGNLYTVYGSMSAKKQDMYFAVFVENTFLKKDAWEYRLSRPSVMYFVVDTYEDLVSEMRGSDRYRLIAEIDRLLEEYIGAQDGMLRKIDSSRYIAVVEERGMENIMNDKFSVLDKVSRIVVDASRVVLSGGVGRLGKTFSECEEMAINALDMAMGRGGNQVAVKTEEGYAFFGGVSAAPEKKSKVRSRIMAESIKSLIEKNKKVLVMGHKNSDMDSLGACIGMWRFANLCGKDATIVIDAEKTMAASLLKYLKKEGCTGEFISPEHALPLAGEETLLIIVDTHLPYLIESAQIHQKCKDIVVIDHHRKMVQHIDNAKVFYHDTTASSASELVSEMLEQLTEGRHGVLAVPEANALLCGILLDTRTFALHVGVHTFEAAAYLKKMGAEAEVAKSMFTTSMSEYVQRSILVANSELFKDFAVSINVGEDTQNPSLIASQAANDLLGIDDVRASIVAVKNADTTYVSARSMGMVNVQLIMEKLGGGGHLTMAAAQLAGVDAKEIRDKIIGAISDYLEEHSN